MSSCDEFVYLVPGYSSDKSLRQLCSQSCFYLGWPAGPDGFEAPHPRTSSGIFGLELVMVIVRWELVLVIFKYELVLLWAKHVAGVRPVVCHAVACPLVSLSKDGRTSGRTDGRTDGWMDGRMGGWTGM